MLFIKQQVKIFSFLFIAVLTLLLSSCGANIIGPACIADGSFVSADDAKSTLISTYSSRNVIEATNFFFEVSGTGVVTTISFFIEVPLYIPEDALTATPRFFPFCEVMIGGIEVFPCEDIPDNITITSDATANESDIQIDITVPLLQTSVIGSLMFDLADEDEAATLVSLLTLGSARLSLAAITAATFSGSDEITEIGGPILLNLFGSTDAVLIE